jgi:CHAD domain-containing protein
VETSDEPIPRKLRLAPQESLSAAVIAAFAYGAGSLERERAASIAGEPEPIHQLRVASRRLRAAAEMFSSALHASQMSLLERDLSWVAQIAGKVRECDVIAATIRARAPKLEPRLAAMLPPLYSELEVSRRLALAQLAGALDSRRYSALIARLHKPRIRIATARQPLGPAAGAMLARMTGAMVRAAAKLTGVSDAKTVHRLRVRVKRMRYALEMLAAIGGKRSRKALARLEDLQDLLGVFNDTIVAIGWLIAYASAEGAPTEAVLAAGAMAESLRRRERKLARRCVKAWRKFDRAGIMKDAIAEIRRHGRAIPQAQSRELTSATET